MVGAVALDNENTNSNTSTHTTDPVFHLDPLRQFPMERTSQRNRSQSQILIKYAVRKHLFWSQDRFKSKPREY